MDNKELGLRIRKKRNEKGLKQADVAKVCGISVNYYSSVESGKKSPSITTLELIADALYTSLVSLICGSFDDMESRVAKEEKRLHGLFEDISKNQRELAQGLITQAARLRILLDDNWKDIMMNGEYEKFKQSENQIPYDRKRPIVENYDNRDRTYQTIINQLTELLPKNKAVMKNKLLGK